MFFAALFGYAMAAAYAAPQQFQHSQVNAGAQLPTMNVADLNKDGRGDLVAGTYGAGQIKTFPGNGNGTFGSAINSSALSLAHRLALAEFNNDGNADAAVAESWAGNGRLKLFLGNGAGAFTSLINYSPQDDCQTVVTGDLNNDGNVDIIYGFLSFVKIETLLGNGAASFVAGPSTPMKSHLSIAVGDLNADGRADVVSATATNVVAALSTPTGFGHVTQYSAGLAHGVAVGDLNHDGLLDIASACPAPGTISIMFANGFGGFAPANFIAGGVSPLYVTIGDVTTDGNADLAVTSAAVDVLSVIVGNGLGGFAAPVPFAVASQPQEPVISDLNLDGFNDLAVPTISGQAVSVLIQQDTVPVGIAPFGSGTPGCTGEHRILSNSVPASGNANFGLTCTNAPANSIGLGLITDVGNIGGFDPFAIQTIFYVDIAASSVVETADFASDASGAGFAGVPVPASPSIIGNSYFAQVLWLWAAPSNCVPSPLGLSSSNGIVITVQP